VTAHLDVKRATRRCAPSRRSPLKNVYHDAIAYLWQPGEPCTAVNRLSLTQK